MLEVQKYLLRKTEEGFSPVAALQCLNGVLGIRVAINPHNPLVILNYDMIDSPKHHPIVQECRGLTLELGTWDVVARSFNRFFNAGENPEQERLFDWMRFSATSKEDGSLMLLYRYKDSWRVNTRGSFALGEMSPGLGKNWEEVFYSAIDEVAMDDILSTSCTYVFEMCSPYNKVVRRYDKPTLFLLTAFDNQEGNELNGVVLDGVAMMLQVQRPIETSFLTLEQCQGWLENQNDPTFEGWVFRDKNGLRIKVKSSRYVALHRLKNNNNGFLPKNLLPLVMKGEQDEVLTYFPEASQRLFDMAETLYGQFGRMEAVWNAAKQLEKQKDFALFVLKHTCLASILFEARKRKVEPKEVWKDSGDLLLKCLFTK